MEVQRGRRLIAKNSVFNLLGQVLPMLVGVVTIPYIVKGLGTNAYGILSIAMMVLGYFSIFDLGLGRATVKFVAENLSPDKVDQVPELVWTSLSLLFALGCVGGLLAATFVPYAVTHLFKMPPSFVGEARTSLLILCAAMPVMLTNDAIRGVLEAAQRFDLVNCVKVPSSVMFYLVAAVTIPLGVGVSGIVLLLVLIRLTSSIVYLALCLKVFPGLKTHIGVSRKALRPLAVFGGWIMVSNAAGPIFGYLERFMIASLLSVGLLTFYSVPYDLVSKIIIFPAAVVPSLFPYFSYHGSRQSTEVSEITSRTVKYLLLVLTPFCAVFIFFAKDILQLWMGPQFAAQSTTTMQIITMVFFLNAFAMIPFTSVQALGRPDLKAILDLVVLPTYGITAWVLMKRYGINGAAGAKLLITILDCTVLYAFASRLKAFSFRDCFTGPLSRAIVASGGLFCASLLIGSLHEGLMFSVPLMLVCIGCYMAVFWIFAVDEEDRITINGLAQRGMNVLRGRAPAAVEIPGNDAGV